MARNNGDLLRVEPMKVAPESLPWEKGSGHRSSRDELKAPKTNGFVEGEATACQVFPISGDGERG
jgi:hypothetical protein